MLEWILGNSAVAALFALAATVLSRVHGSRPALSHFLWVMALVALLMPRLPLIGTPGGELRRRLQAWLPTADRVDPATQTGRPESGLALSELPATGDDVFSAPAILDPTAKSPAAKPAARSWFAGVDMQTWLFVVWLAGGFAVFATSAARVLAFQRRVRASGRGPASLHAEVKRVAGLFGLRAPGIRILTGVSSPSVWCFGRPKLLWPVAPPTSNTPAARSTLIAHELAHLARRDHWISWLEVPATALLWWNPLFWLIRGRIRHFAELSCDAWAMWAYPADRRAFAEALIDMQARTASVLVPVQGLGATDSEFKDFERRLNMIMKKRVNHGVSKGAAAVALIATILASPGLSDGQYKKKPEKAYSAAAEPAAVQAHVELAQMTKKAEALYKQQKYDQALEVFEQVVASDPGNGKAHGRIGYILISRGEHSQATKHFKLQYKLGYERSTALYNLACTKALAGYGDEALEVVALALQHGFTNVELMTTDSDLASIRGLAGYQDLVQRAEAATDLKRKLAEVKLGGDKSVSLALHGELAHIQSSRGELLSEHGHMAMKAGDYEAAAWAFARQAEVAHQTATAHYNLACALSLVNDVDGGLEMLERASAEGMSYPDVVTDTDLDNLRHDPRFAQLQEHIAAPGLARQRLKQQLDSGDRAAAMPGLKKMIGDAKRSDKERAWATQALGRLLMDQGRYQDALATFEHAAEMGYGVERSALNMAEALAGLGDDESSLRHVEYAVQLGCDDAEAVRVLLAGNTLCSPGDAEQLVERAALAAKAGAYVKKQGAYREKKAYGEKQAYAAKKKPGSYEASKTAADY